MAGTHCSAVTRCNYTMDEEALRCLDEIVKTRTESGLVDFRHCTKSMIVREAVVRLYDYEVLHLSRVHPADMGPEDMICQDSMRLHQLGTGQGPRTA